MWILLILALAIVAVFMIRAWMLHKAEQEYHEALERLETNPADNGLRIAALEAGRRYADLARKAAGSKGRAIFDEVALSNDLAARSGAAPSASDDTKKCPQCAELVKLDARICRFCQHKFTAAA